jgi:glycerol-3-phosphate acyltransferase PlsY|tara:strand:- start:24039 stop:24671 length:633 start_codon:yes stop_codon:yes gene_type:complete
MDLNYIFYPLIGYFLGSIPTAVWLGKSKYGIDVREHGSNNAGATNTFRVLGQKAGIVVLCIDVLKGLIATLLPLILMPDKLGSDALVNIQMLSSMACVLGHVFPIFANFDGGKGVATSLGVIIGLHPPAAIIAMGIFLAIYLATSFVSLGAMCAALSFPLLLYFRFHVDSINLIAFSSILSIAVVIAHRKNIVRLLNRTESKMPLFRKKE